MNKNRIGWIDAAKGLAMFLVVLGHNPLPQSTVETVYLLNVPIFFLMSGYTFRTEKYQSLWMLVKKLAIRVLLPYVIMNIIAFPVYYAARDMVIDLSSVKQLLWGMLYGAGIGNSLKTNIPMWFLPCIFCVQCIWYMIDRYAKKTKFIWIILLSAIGYFIYGIIKMRLPWGMDVALTGTVFFAVGHMLRQEKIEKMLFRLPSALGCALLLALALGINAVNKSAVPYVDINAMVFGNYFLFYLSTLSGCLGIIYLARVLEKSKALGFVGRNTMWVLGLHSIFIQLFELVLKLNFVSDQRLNSLILTVLEIAGVAVLKLSYDFLKKEFLRIKTRRGKTKCV